MEKEKVNYKAHVLQWKESGKSKASYCKENRISYHGLNYHVKKDKVKPNPKSKGFVQVQVEEIVLGGVEFYFGEGNRFVFKQGCSAKFIHEVLFGC